jgi:cytochrome c oxidase assembly factor CtaG
MLTCFNKTTIGMYTFWTFTRLIILILIGIGIYLIYRRWQEIKQERKNKGEEDNEQ